MSCWQVLGIEPTRNPSEIQSAYNQQVKFANSDEVRALDNALHEAMAQAGVSVLPVNKPVESSHAEAGGALSAADHQVVREVVLQVHALLNDSARVNDVAVWKAVLTEPPADRAEMREHLAEKLEGQLRSLAKQGTLPAGVADFLGQWFGWSELVEVVHQSPQQSAGVDVDAQVKEELSPVHKAERESMKHFWPAAIGWIIGLIVLTSLFSNMTGH